MKKLGLIGGTGPESTLIYYKTITSQVEKKTGKFPYLTIESLSVLTFFSMLLQMTGKVSLNIFLKGFSILLGQAVSLQPLQESRPM